MEAYGVVIPAWNAARTLAEAVASVQAQTVPPARLIVVNDGSTDETGRIVRELGLGVELLEQTNTGPGAATTTGFAALDTPLIATLDADDLWLPEKMAKQLAALRANTGAAMCYSVTRQFHHGIPDDGTGEVRRGPNRTNMVIRRNLFETVGPMIDPPGLRGDLIDWLARGRSAGFYSIELDEVLALRRVLPGSLSWGRDPARDRGYLTVVHRALMAHRRQEHEL
jgi:glycosyltransferase involved in cell wall biosynthesis